MTFINKWLAIILAKFASFKDLLMKAYNVVCVISKTLSEAVKLLESIPGTEKIREHLVKAIDGIDTVKKWMEYIIKLLGLEIPVSSSSATSIEELDSSIKKLKETLNK